MASDIDLVTTFAKRQGRYSFERDRYLALFGEDERRAARALWSSLDLGADRVGNVLADDGAIDLLSCVAGEVSTTHALHLFRLLADRPGTLANDPVGTNERRPYRGWCLGLDRILDALPDRGVLVQEWGALAEPVRSALGLALACRGDVPGAALPPDALPRLAAAAVAHSKWCPGGFARAGQVFGEEAWGRAVIERAASAEVDRVQICIADIALWARLATDAELLAVLRKVDVHWTERHDLAGLVVGRGPAMQALLKSAADAALTDHHDYGARQFNLIAYAIELANSGQDLPKRFEDLLLGLLEENPPRESCVSALLCAMNPDRREALLLGWAQKLFSTGSLERAAPHELREFKTPAIARWAVATVRTAADPERVRWLENLLPGLGPEALHALAAVPELPNHLQAPALFACQRYPSEAAAELATRIVLVADDDCGKHAEEVLAKQPAPAIATQVRARWADASAVAQARLARVLAARAFEPEVQAVLATLAPGVTSAAALAAATDPLWRRPPVTTFVSAARAWERALKAGDEPHIWPTPEQRIAYEAHVRGAPSEVAGAAAYRWLARQEVRNAAQVAGAWIAANEGARALFVLCPWGTWDLDEMVRLAGDALVDPLIALWESPALRAHLTADQRAHVITVLAALNLPRLIDLLARTSLPTDAGAAGSVRAAVRKALRGEHTRGHAVEILRKALTLPERQLALQVAATEDLPELVAELRALEDAKLTKSERQSLRATLMLSAPKRPTFASARVLPLRDVAVVSKVAVSHIEACDEGVAVRTGRELVLLTPKGRERGRAPCATESFHLSEGGDYVVALYDDGVGLFSGTMERVLDAPDAVAEGGLLRPNDGVCGALPLGPDRLLVWATGHNVYEPLTLYDPRSGQEIARVKTKAFVTAAATQPDDEANFVSVCQDGTVELRAKADGRRIQKLLAGSSEDESGPWPGLRVIDGGRGMLIVRKGCGATLLVRQPNGKYKRAFEVDDPDGEVVSDARCTCFALISRGRVDVFTREGRRGRMRLEPHEGADESRLYALAGGHLLAVCAAKIARIYDLMDLAAFAYAATPGPITALASDHMSFYVGTSEGAVLRCIP